MRARAVTGFDYAGPARGYWARLRDGGGRGVVLCEYPASLLSMLAAGVLVGQALEDARALVPVDRRDSESIGRRAWTDWRRGQDAIRL